MKPENTSKTPEQQREEVRAKINKINTAFMTTVNADGSLHGRPMATAQLDEQWDTLWFCCHKTDGKIKELKSDSHIHLSYTGSGDWVAVSGRGSVVDDRAKIKEIYSPIWDNWFKGPDDPNLVLIRVDPDNAEYWDSGNRVFLWAKYLAGAVVGHKVGSDGENAKVKL